MDTGIVFYVENAVIAPKEYSLDDITTVDIPLIGKASPTVNSGLLKIEKTKWEDGTGLTFAVNAAGSWTNSPPMTVAQKLKGYKDFKGAVDKAHTTNRQEKVTESRYNNKLTTLADIISAVEAADSPEDMQTDLDQALTAAEAYERLYKTHSKQAKDAATALDKSFGTVSAIICFTVE